MTETLSKLEPLVMIGEKVIAIQSPGLNGKLMEKTMTVGIVGKR